MECIIFLIQAQQDWVPSVTTARGFTRSVADGVVVAVAAARTQSNTEIGQILRRLRRKQQLYSATDVVLNSPVNLPFARKRGSRQCSRYPARALQKFWRERGSRCAQVRAVRRRRCQVAVACAVEINIRAAAAVETRIVKKMATTMMRMIIIFVSVIIT